MNKRLRKRLEWICWFAARRPFSIATRAYNLGLRHGREQPEYLLSKKNRALWQFIKTKRRERELLRRAGKLPPEIYPAKRKRP